MRLRGVPQPIRKPFTFRNFEALLLSHHLFADGGFSYAMNMEALVTPLQSILPVSGPTHGSHGFR